MYKTLGPGSTPKHGVGQLLIDNDDCVEGLLFAVEFLLRFLIQ